MRYLFRHWNELERQIEERPLVLLLDYDGTIVPIARTPQAAIVRKPTKQLLSKLTRAPGLRLAVVSGRSLREVRRTVGLRNVVYVGNHGLEIGGRGIAFRFPLPRGYGQLIRRLNERLSREVDNIPGAWVESKGMTLSLHYRQVKRQNLPLLKHRFRRFVEPYVLQKKIRVTPGKKVFEIKPPSHWHKGSAVLWLLKAKKLNGKGTRFLPVYVGDDTTDEDAFRALQKKGLTVFVGRRKKSHAQYYLRNTGEVHEFLRRLLWRSGTEQRSRSSSIPG